MAGVNPMRAGRLTDGWYWFREDRFGSFSACQYLEGRGWFPAGEVGPVSLEELSRRGWDLHSRVAAPEGAD